MAIMSVIKGRIPGFAVLFLFLYPFIRAYLKRQEILRLAKVFPLNPKYDNFFMGYIPFLKKNLNRFFHFREDLFVSGFKTVQVAEPFLSDKPAHLLTRDPELIRYLATAPGFDKWVKASFILETFASPDGLGWHAIFLTPHGPFHPKEHKLWKLQRKTAITLFTNNLLDTVARDVIEKDIKKIIDNIDAKRSSENSAQLVVVDMKDQFFKFTLDAIAEVAFGESTDTLDVDDVNHPKLKFAKAFDDIIITARKYRSSLGFTFVGSKWPRGKAYNECRNLVNDHILKIVRDRMSLPLEELRLKGDILAKFILVMKNEKQDVSEKTLVDFTYSLFIAGRDTTATSLTWVFYLLSLYPDVQEKLFKEVSHVKDFTLDDLSHLHYLDAVVKETLRLFPPLAMMPRSACCDDVLPNGIKVKRGTEVDCEIFVANRDPTVYDQPMEFNPERWLSKAVPEPWDFPVFMAGPRMCLGKDFSAFEMKLLICRLLNIYELAPTSEVCKDFNPHDITLRNGLPPYEVSIALTYKGPLNLILKRRQV